MAKIDTDLQNDIKKYGALDFNACYNCGTCTAVCNLSEQKASFPRIFIRYGVLGFDEDILQSKELWLCYGCGDCSQSCPRDADPAAYLAALRRYAIAKYEPTGITKLIFKSNPLFILITLVLAGILAFFLLTLKPENPVARWIFDMVPFEIIHDTGIILFAITGVLAVFGVLRMIFSLNKKVEHKADRKKRIKALKKTISEIAALKRYQSCDKESDSYWHGKPTIFKPWFVHWTIMWGFIGLIIATTLDFLFKDPATPVWLPTRILGTISGLSMMWGASLAIFYRIKKVTKYYAKSTLADWSFIFFVWLAGFTGFWLEIAVTFGLHTNLNKIIFAIHTVISMELILLFVFSKFVHSIYRPIALYYNYLNEV